MPAAVSESITLKTTHGIAKTAGYSAPEVDLSKHSLKTDVYSYGVVSACNAPMAVTSLKMLSRCRFVYIFL